MRLLGYDITIKKGLYYVNVGIIENEINDRMCFNIDKSCDEFINNFRQFYTFYKIINLIEQNGKFFITKEVLKELDLSEETFKLKLSDFYNTMHIVNKLDMIKECKINKHGVIVQIKNDNLNLAGLSFTKEC